MVEAEAGSLPEADRVALSERVMLLATGLGPLEPLLSDPAVEEVMVNGPGDVWVERGGRLERTGVHFEGEAELMHAIERVLAPLGRRVDEASPLCDARPADGSRVNVVIPPLSLGGPCLTIRRFRSEGFSLATWCARARSGTAWPSSWRCAWRRGPRCWSPAERARGRPRRWAPCRARSPRASAS